MRSTCQKVTKADNHSWSPELIRVRKQRDDDRRQGIDVPEMDLYVWLRGVGGERDKKRVWEGRAFRAGNKEREK